MAPVGKVLVVLGISLFLAGAILLILDRLGLQFGRLPGDIRIERGNFTCVIGLGASILLSILLTLVLNLVARWLNK